MVGCSDTGANGWLWRRGPYKLHKKSESTFLPIYLIKLRWLTLLPCSSLAILATMVLHPGRLSTLSSIHHKIQLIMPPLSKLTSPPHHCLSRTSVIFCFLFFFFLSFLKLFHSNLFPFNWRITALWYCVGFCIYQYDSVIGTLKSPSSWTSLPPPHPSHPSRSSQNTSFEAPAFTQQIPTGYPVLHICFNAPLSIRPTLSFPHCVHKSVCVCVSTAALQTGSSVPPF